MSSLLILLIILRLYFFQLLEQQPQLCLVRCRIPAQMTQVWIPGSNLELVLLALAVALGSSEGMLCSSSQEPIQCTVPHIQVSEGCHAELSFSFPLQGLIIVPHIQIHGTAIQVSEGWHAEVSFQFPLQGLIIVSQKPTVG